MVINQWISIDMAKRFRRIGTHLAGGVNDVEMEVLTLVLDDLLERVLDGRVVGIDEMRVDELDGEGRFACRSIRRASGKESGDSAHDVGSGKTG